jgi:hypothetical protein
MVPQGSWIHTAKSYKIESGILYAELFKPDGTVESTSIALYDGVEYHNINGTFCVGNVNNTMFVRLGNQLGNCLRILTSTIIIAKHFGKNIFIDYDCPSLMGKEKIIIKELFPQLCLTGCSHFYEQFDYASCVHYDAYNHTNYHLFDEGRLLECPTSNNFSIIETIYSILPAQMSYLDYNRDKIRLYQSLHFPSFLQKDVDLFLHSNNISNFIGFHIRYTDNLNDTSKQRYNTSLETFLDKIREYDERGESIFLCSDNENVIATCKQICPTIISPNQCSSRTHQALYEMILLSKTKRIVGSNSSTFSYESAYLSGGTDIELFENSKWEITHLYR